MDSLYPIPAKMLTGYNKADIKILPKKNLESVFSSWEQRRKNPLKLFIKIF